MYKPITFLLKYIFKTAGKVEVQGREKLPEGGPYVVACTHTSFMDVLMLATGMYPTQIHYMAKKNYLKGNSKIGSLKCKCIPCRSCESRTKYT